MLNESEFRSKVRDLMCNNFDLKCRDEFHICTNSLDNSSIKTPTVSNITYKNLKNAINFHPKEDFSSLVSRNQYSKDNSVRNKHIKDLSYLNPKCCFFSSNIFKDRKKARKLKKYNLNKQIRKFPKEPVEFSLTCLPVLSVEEYEKIPITFVDEFYVISDSDSDDESEEEYRIAEDAEDIERQCSACSTLNEVHMRKVKPREKVQEEKKESKIIDSCIYIVKELKNRQKKVGKQQCCF